MSRMPSPWLRAGLLLCCVAVVGALVGATWESTLTPEEEAFDEGSLAGLPESPLWYDGPSEASRRVVERATAELPPYKDAVPQALDADYLGPGSRIAVAWFTTRDTPDEVLGFYHQTLLEAGLPVLAHRYNANAGYVGFQEPFTQETHLVSVLAQSGTSWVFVSSGEATTLLEGQMRLPEELPMPVKGSARLLLSRDTKEPTP